MGRVPRVPKLPWANKWIRPHVYAEAIAGRDCEEVWAIEVESYLDPRPWSVLCRDVEACRTLPGHMGALVACSGSGSERRVLAYAFYKLYAAHLRVTRLAVASHVRRDYLGSFLLERIEREARTRRRHRVVCDVDEKNLDAQLFLKARGYACRSIVTLTESDPPKVAYHFARELMAPKVEQLALEPSDYRYRPVDPKGGRS